MGCRFRANQALDNTKERLIMSVDYSTSVVVYVRHLGGSNLPINTHQALSSVKRAFDGEFDEVKPGALYAGEDGYGTPVVITGFEKVIAAVKRDNLVLSSRTTADQGPVIPVVVSMSYNTPWHVRNIAGKAWEQIIALLNGESTRWSKFLNVYAVQPLEEFLGAGGAVSFVADEDKIDTLISDIFDDAVSSLIGTDDDDDDDSNDAALYGGDADGAVPLDDVFSGTDTAVAGVLDGNGVRVVFRR